MFMLISYPGKRQQSILGFFNPPKKVKRQQTVLEQTEDTPEGEDCEQVQEHEREEQEQEGEECEQQQDETEECEQQQEHEGEEEQHQDETEECEQEHEGEECEQHEGEEEQHQEHEGEEERELPPGAHDISKSKLEGPTQPHLKAFPKTMQGCAQRSFRKDWYAEHTWLEYSQAQNAAYCFACRHFGFSKGQGTVFTSKGGYSNWKKATNKDGGFTLHSKSEAHGNAMMAWGEHQKMTKNKTSVLGMMSKTNKDQIEENKHYLKTLAEVLLLTATQNIALRGHNESETSKNQGNFREILNLVSKHDPFVKKRSNVSKLGEHVRK
ncbi:probable serine/threonine-protein kinase irlF [Engraulis encrasicolus]|uniref:probable serine/threonine-protein kinase irlF n=1 Tax=Engraulis encrasicolus TaxID=184585 RepID=UPI002FD4BCAD